MTKKNKWEIVEEEQGTSLVSTNSIVWGSSKKHWTIRRTTFLARIYDNLRRVPASLDDSRLFIDKNRARKACNLLNEGKLYPYRYYLKRVIK